MRMRPRLLRLFSLVFAAALTGAGSAVPAQDHGTMDMGAKEAPATMRQLRWSDPATWPNGRVPRAGDAVTIARDMDVLLDVDAPGLRSLTIQGRMRFADTRDTKLESEWIYLPGGERAGGNGVLIEALAACARRAGRGIASPEEARALLAGSRAIDPSLPDPGPFAGSD